MPFFVQHDIFDKNEHYGEVKPKHYNEHTFEYD